MPYIPKHKFNTVRIQLDGLNFDSKKEGRYYLELKNRVKTHEIIFFLRQVPIDLPGGVKYRVDFLEFHSDGTVHFTDVKGMITKEFILKKKIVENLYPFSIEIK